MGGISEKPRFVTYSRTKRRLLEDNSPSIKRRRVVTNGTTSDEDEDDIVKSIRCTTTESSPLPESSPPGPAIFSDENTIDSSPPSSPAPTLIETQTRTTLDTSKPQRQLNAFSMLRRQPISKQKNYPPKKPLVQMQLNLGQPFQKKCKICGMTYMPSSPEDLSLHKKYHAQNINGISISKDFLKKAESWRGIEWIGQGGDDRIVSISRRRRCQSGRPFIMPVLEVVQAELGAVDIPENLLWSLCSAELPSPNHTSSRDSVVQAESGQGPCQDRYKAYLYIHGTKCVGLCLTERINKAFKVLEPQKTFARSEGIENEEGAFQAQNKIEGEEMPDTDPDAPVIVAEEADDVCMGISRIWVSSSFRKKGIASALLDCASKTFRERQITPKNLIAFSQPTQSGARLARRWFGTTSGWHVYTDCKVVMELRNGEWFSRRDHQMSEPKEVKM